MHNKGSRSKEQVWLTIFSDSKIILQKSKKIFKNQTKFASLADDWSSEARSKHLEAYLLRSRSFQIEHNNNLIPESSFCKHHDFVANNVNRNLDIAITVILISIKLQKSII